MANNGDGARLSGHLPIKNIPIALHGRRISDVLDPKHYADRALWYDPAAQSLYVVARIWRNGLWRREWARVKRVDTSTLETEILRNG